MDDKHIDILKKAVITKTTPGSLIADFEMLLTEAEQTGIPLSEKTKHIAMGQLFRINESLTTPLITEYSRPKQESLPNINGLYLLLRISGLTKVQRKEKKRILVAHGPAVEIWRGLSNEEKYVSLFKYFLFSSHDLVHRLGGNIPKSPYLLFSLFESIKLSPVKIKGNSDLELSCTYNYGTHFLVLLEMFGLVTITQAKAKKGEKWFPGSIAKTPLGEALIALLADSLAALQSTQMGQLEPNDCLIEMFAPYVSNVKHLLPDADEPMSEFRDGLYTFYVTLQKSSCRIIIPASASFSSFSNAILGAFNFDNDHLYMFKFEDCFGTKIEIAHEEDLDAYSSDETTIGDLSMDEGDEIQYVFDFGDWWEFGIVLEQINTPDKHIKQAKIMNRKGTPPEQYPYNDDWM